MYRGASGQPIQVELRGGDGDDIQKKGILTTADMWRQIGIGAEPVIVPSARQRDLEYRANFPVSKSAIPGWADRHSLLAGIRAAHRGEQQLQRSQPQWLHQSRVEALADRYIVAVNSR